MTTQELRIGNWVKKTTTNNDGIAHEVKVVGILNSQNIIGIPTGTGLFHTTFKMKVIEPIPITQEWLDRFGIKPYSSPVCAGVYGNGKVWVEAVTGSHCVDNDILEHIKYVHQLQNLYYALTNKELI